MNQEYSQMSVCQKDEAIQVGAWRLSWASDGSLLAHSAGESMSAGSETVFARNWARLIAYGWQKFQASLSGILAHAFSDNNTSRATE